MEKSLFKYVLTALFFLILGTETMMSYSTHSASAISILENKEKSEGASSEKWVSSDEISTAAFNTSSFIWQSETYRLSNKEQERDLIRTIRFYPKFITIPSTQNVVKNNFMHLLTERYYQGFYVYTLKKLII